MTAAKADRCLAEAGAAEPGLAVEVLAGLSAAERTWRAFEPHAAKTPFQRFDWVSAYVGDREAVRVVALHDGAGRLRLLLPVCRADEFGCHLGVTVGGRHASFTLPLMAPDRGAPLCPDDVRRALKEAGRILGVDAFVLPCLPTNWPGAAHPLPFSGTPAASPAHFLRLSRDADETLARGMSRDARRKLRSKERRLATLGRVSFVRPEESSARAELLDAFFRQKQVRFRELGIPDPFGSDEIRSFLDRAVLPGGMGDEPAVELFALTLDDQPLAILGAAVDGRHLCGMFNSFDIGAEAAKLSPGDILVSRVIRHGCERGISTFDLGVGDARYKRSFCNEELALLDVVLPVTPRGRLYGAARSLGVSAKRRFKSSPAAMTALAALRRARPGE